MINSAGFRRVVHILGDNYISYMDRSIDYATVDLKRFEYFLVRRDIRRVNIVYELNKSNVEFVAVSLLSDFVLKTDITKVKIDSDITDSLEHIVRYSRMLYGMDAMFAYMGGTSCGKCYKKKRGVNFSLSVVLKAYHSSNEIGNRLNSLIQKDIFGGRYLSDKSKVSLLKKV